MWGKLGHRWALKERAQSQFGAYGGADSADETCSQKGVSTQREKIIVNADALDGKRLRKDGTQSLFARSARRTMQFLTPFGSWKGILVHLSIRSQWKLV